MVITNHDKQRTTVSTGVKGITIERRDIMHEDVVEEITEVEEEDGADAAAVVLDTDTITSIRIMRRMYRSFSIDIRILNYYHE